MIQAIGVIWSVGMGTAWGLMAVASLLILWARVEARG
jgi:hypothetical protein